MAKKKVFKKTTDTDTDTDTDTINVLEEEVLTLEKKLDAARELLGDKDATITEMQQNISDLKQQIDSDKGIAPDSNQQVLDLVKQVKALKGSMSAINTENEKLKLVINSHPIAGNTSGMPKTKLPLSLLIACLSDTTLSSNPIRFEKQIPSMLKNMVTLGNAVMSCCDDYDKDTEE